MINVGTSRGRFLPWFLSEIGPAAMIAAQMTLIGLFLIVNRLLLQFKFQVWKIFPTILDFSGV